ncbi:MAG: radical SAM protein [Desulfohalobiaceae bacterium]|nr:radical SAM protein [Desulfohalobiaceae bacterium]
MYLVDLKHENAAYSGSGGLSARTGKKTISKWNVLSSAGKEKDTELLRLLALACSGCAEYLDRLPFDLTRLIGNKDESLQLEFLWSQHLSQAKRILEKPQKQSGIEITPEGKGRRLHKASNYLISSRMSYEFLSKLSPPDKHLVVAYGSDFLVHDGSDDFDFEDPFYQLRRITSLFDKTARLTDPGAFLNNLNYRAVYQRRYMPYQILATFQELLPIYIGLDTSDWLKRGVDFSKQIANLFSRQSDLFLPVLDAARHFHDALPSHPNPMAFPGIMVLDSPDNYCPPELMSDWLGLLEQAFPNMQFFLSLSASSKELILEKSLSKELPEFPSVKTTNGVRDSAGQKKQAHLPANSILLVDVDSTLPNLALMKLSGYYKKLGYNVELRKKEAYEKKAEAVYASSVFASPISERRLKKMRDYYGNSFQCGGSGWDLYQRLPDEIEKTSPDFQLYPALGDRAIGFLTRGCPFKCSFCIVPRKEGPPSQASHIDPLLRGRDKLILLDDNILSHPNSKQLLREMARRKIQVNFNQTLDLHLVDREIAELIRAIPCRNVKFTRPVYHFSLNDNQDLEELRKKYELFDFTHKDNVQFVCMYGYNTTLVQDLERFRFLRSLPGAYVFFQKYQPILNGPEPELENFFDEHADQYLDELVQICFTQSMKSMEKYFRWVSRLYAERFGKLHMGLVDTIFRYNRRFNRGKYIATLAGTRNLF